MNEMQLFEVGLSQHWGGAYWEKYYVAAANDLDARGKAKRYAIKLAEEGEEAFENEEERQVYLDEIANLFITRIQSLGMVIV